MTVLGALAYGELAAMYPRAGGMYTFLRESMSPLMGFLYGWTLFVVIQTGTIAAVAVGFAQVPRRALAGGHAGHLRVVSAPVAAHVRRLGRSTSGSRRSALVALVSIWVLTWINLRGVKEGKFVQTTLTVIKTLSLAALVLLALTVGRNAAAVTANFGANWFAGIAARGAALFVVTFGSALVGSLFSADSWHSPTFAAAEVQNPQKNLPRALLFGTVLVSMLYILANLGYLSVLPLHGSGRRCDGHRARHRPRDATIAWPPP